MKNFELETVDLNYEILKELHNTLTENHDSTKRMDLDEFFRKRGGRTGVTRTLMAMGLVKRVRHGHYIWSFYRPDWNTALELLTKMRDDRNAYYLSRKEKKAEQKEMKFAKDLFEESIPTSRKVNPFIKPKTEPFFKEPTKDLKPKDWSDLKERQSRLSLKSIKKAREEGLLSKPKTLDQWIDSLPEHQEPEVEKPSDFTQYVDVNKNETSNTSSTQSYTYSVDLEGRDPEQFYKDIKELEDQPKRETIEVQTDHKYVKSVDVRLFGLKIFTYTYNWD